MICTRATPVALLRRAARPRSVTCRRSQSTSTDGTTDGTREAPFPFLWPNLEQPPATCPHLLPSIISANPNRLSDRFLVSCLSLLVRFPTLNRALNLGWTSMLLTRPTFPQNFIGGALLGFEEFLRRLSSDNAAERDVSDMCGESLTEMLQPLLEDGAAAREGSPGISLVNKGGKIGVRDCWLFIGPESAFHKEKQSGGGLIRTAEVKDPNSPVTFIQLPYTSVVQRERDIQPLGLECEAGMQVHVDIEFSGDFEYRYAGETMTQSETSLQLYA